MKTHHSRTQVNEMRQAESCLLQALLIGSTNGNLPAFENKETCFFYQGQVASVEMDKSSGRLKVYPRGQETPFYDSSDLDGCVDLEYSWELSFEVSKEIQRAVCKAQREVREAMRSTHH
jgi:hypothetical protein